MCCGASPSWCQRAIGIRWVPRVRKISAIEATLSTTAASASALSQPRGASGATLATYAAIKNSGTTPKGRAVAHHRALRLPSRRKKIFGSAPMRAKFSTTNRSTGSRMNDNILSKPLCDGLGCGDDRRERALAATGQPPVPPAHELHGRGNDDEPDNGGVQRDGNGQTEAELLDRHDAGERERPEHRDHEERGP